MTLIAAFRYQVNERKGVIICADSQETVGGVRVAVNKVVPQKCGHYLLIFGGAGNADLIESFADTLATDMGRWPPSLDENVVKGNIRNLLLDFHENEVAQYPAASADDKLVHSLVCIRSVDADEVFLWELRGSAIVPVGNYTLLGIGEAIYKHELKRLTASPLNARQAQLLGIHLLSLAKDTSNYVGGEVQVITVFAEGSAIQSQESVIEDERLITEMNKAIAELVLACPNLYLTKETFKAILNKFQERVLELRASSWQNPWDDIEGSSAARTPVTRKRVRSSKPRKSKGQQ